LSDDKHRNENSNIVLKNAVSILLSSNRF